MRLRTLSSLLCRLSCARLNLTGLSLQVVIKLAEHDLSPNALSALRFATAAICFMPLAVRGLRNEQLRLAAAELALWLFGEATSLRIAPVDCKNAGHCQYCYILLSSDKVFMGCGQVFCLMPGQRMALLTHCADYRRIHGTSTRA